MGELEDAVCTSSVIEDIEHDDDEDEDDFFQENT